MNLSLKDIDFINNIYNIEYQNKIIYSGLDKLELEDKTNSKKYKKKLKVLKDYFEDEQKFLNYNIDYFIYMYPVIYEFASSVAFVEKELLFPSFDIAKLRVLDRVGNAIYYNSDNDQLNKKALESFNGLLLFNELSFHMLNKATKKEEDETVKEGLMQMKYNNIYTTASVEKSFLYGGKSTKKIIKELTSYSDNDAFTTSISNIFNYTLTTLEKYSDEDYDDKIKLTVIKYMFTRLKAALVIFPQSFLDELNKNYYKLLKENKKSKYLNYVMNNLEEANKIKQKVAK